MVDPANDLLQLLPQHREDLRRSGLSDESIQRWGCYSLEQDQKSVLVQLGFGHLDPPALALPILSPDRPAPNLNEVIVKPDNPRRDARGRSIKYECRPGSRNRIHVPLAVRDKLGDTSVTLILTEGAKKAEKAAQEGLCCIAIPGVWNWLDRVGTDSFPIADFDFIPLARRVVTCFDSDAVANSHVQHAERSLSGFVAKRGAQPWVKRLPAGPRGEKVGLDDFLVAYGVEAFHRLPEQSIDLEPPASAQPTWPEPLDEIAFHGLAGELVRTIEPHSEADPPALLLQFLVCFGNVVGPSPHFVAEDSRHGCNLNVVLVGATSSGRKGSAWSRILKLFTIAEPDWSRNRIKSGLSSGEGLIYHVRDPEEKEEPIQEKGNTVGRQTVVVDRGVSDKRLLIFESEFASALRIMSREGNIVSPILRQAWDSGNLSTLTRNSPLKATAAHISLVGHITRTELLVNLSNTDIASGLANRILWACVRRSKYLPWGSTVGGDRWKEHAQAVRQAIEFSRSVGEMTVDKEAGALWEKVYADLCRDEPGLFGALLVRAAPSVRRLAMLYALLGFSGIVRAEHLRAALAIWEFCESSARFIFQNSLGDPTADAILSALRNNPQGLTRTELRDLFGRNKNGTELDRALGLLAELNLAQKAKQPTAGSPQPTAGRPSELWVACAAGGSRE